jgi:hypothetical protein
MLNATEILTQLVTDKEILITMLIPRIGVRRIRAFRSTRVSRLSKFFPNQQINFVHEGEILSLDSALGDYGMSDGSLVVAVPMAATQAGTTHTWLSLTRSDDHLSRMADLCANSQVRAEYARLRDLSMRKMEWRPRKFRRFLEHHRRPIGLGQLAQMELTIIPDSPIEMSTAPLPAPW